MKVAIHKANIPVNVDAEYVVSMALGTPTFKVQVQDAMK